jgi:hypothetical protein
MRLRALIAMMRKAGMYVDATAIMDDVAAGLRRMGRKPRHYRWHRKLLLNRLRREVSA